MPLIEPTPNETELQEDIELEKFEKIHPEVTLQKNTRTTHTNLDVDVDNQLGDPVTLNAEFDLQSRLKELRDGIWIKTQKLELRFSKKQLDNKNVTIERGDVIDLFPENGEKYEVIQVGGSSSKIRMTSTQLHITVTIDLEHKWTT